ncbi:hypothetical protein FD754_002153 [Muntiacus muntjak]|uniref:Uncharacterized protein n=1 Tax=Muntiacus muntjak TaxID=9888 RepID=A0A5N3W9X2_MUNMU|nr:hypothetical protein FD754_002153 [Muntiacus muntjak]
MKVLFLYLPSLDWTQAININVVSKKTKQAQFKRKLMFQLLILNIKGHGRMQTSKLTILTCGLYVFVVYFILHNQTCCPMKASYTVEMNGHPGPSTAFFTPGSGMPAAGGEISKSTQNLISAMEEVPPDWERASFQQASQASPDLKPSPQNGATFPSSGGYGQGSLIADEESQEFDDLIFALKTGAGLSVSDNESGQGSQDGGTLTDSQIVELRRIPIADTHL